MRVITWLEEGWFKHILVPQRGIFEQCQPKMDSKPLQHASVPFLLPMWWLSEILFPASPAAAWRRGVSRVFGAQFVMSNFASLFGP